MESIYDGPNDQVRSGARRVAADVAGVAENMRIAASAKLALGNGASTLKRQARQAADSADGYVHENPWQALGVAALVGVAIGLLATRRS